MSKRLKNFVLAACLAGIIPTTVAADDYGMADARPPATRTTAPAKESYGVTLLNKLGSGFTNIGLGFLEIPKNMINTSNEINLAVGFTGGAAKGVLHMGGRMFAGIVDLVSFPVPTEPLTTPRYVWQNYTVETRYNPLKVK